MNKEHRPLVERALKQVNDPALAHMKTQPRLEKVLAQAARSGDLDVHELGRTTKDFGREAVALRMFSGTDPETGEKMSWGVLILLMILLLILAALAEDDSDAAAELRQTIEDLIDAIRRGAASGGDGDGDGNGDSDGTENDGRDDEEGR